MGRDHAGNSDDIPQGQPQQPQQQPQQMPQRKRRRQGRGMDRVTPYSLWKWFLAVMKTILAMLSDVSTFWIKRVFFGGATRQRLAVLQKNLESAQTYAEWSKIATEIDRLNGKEIWKETPSSADFDFALIERRLKQLRQMRESEDVWSIIFLLRAGLSRNLGGIGNPKLFSHTLVGTKHIIEEYIEELRMCLEIIAEYNSPELPLKAKLEFFSGLRQVFGRSALLLSGGATLGLYHLGVIKCLFEHNLLPRIFSGSSAGSLMAALVCTRTDEELPTIFDPENINMEAIERRGEGTARRRITRLLQHGYLFDIEVLQECIRSNIGDLTFQEAFNRTRRILNITVSSSTVHELPRLLNYLTAPNVLIWSAASASSAIPGLYHPVPLMAKTKDGLIVPWNPAGTSWVDGSVENDLPMARLSEQFNVNHFIVSQVNPHVVPFLSQEQPLARGTFFERLGYLLTSELTHRINQVMELGIFPIFLQRVFHWSRMIISQRYQGDITIVPPVSTLDYFSIMKNPDHNDLHRKVELAERAAWQKLSIIEMHCRTEKAIDGILYRLRVRQLERQGKAYRPIDFALALTLDDEEDSDTQMGKRTQSLGSNLASAGLPRSFAS